MSGKLLLKAATNSARQVGSTIRTSTTATSSNSVKELADAVRERVGESAAPIVTVFETACNDPSLRDSAAPYAGELFDHVHANQATEKEQLQQQRSEKLNYNYNNNNNNNNRLSSIHGQDYFSDFSSSSASDRESEDESDGEELEASPSPRFISYSPSESDNESDSEDELRDQISHPNSAPLPLAYSPSSSEASPLSSSVESVSSLSSSSSSIRNSHNENEEERLGNMGSLPGRPGRVSRTGSRTRVHYPQHYHHHQYQNTNYQRPLLKDKIWTFVKGIFTKFFPFSNSQANSNQTQYESDQDIEEIHNNNNNNNNNHIGTIPPPPFFSIAHLDPTSIVVSGVVLMIFCVYIRNHSWKVGLSESQAFSFAVGTMSYFVNLVAKKKQQQSKPSEE